MWYEATCPNTGAPYYYNEYNEVTLDLPLVPPTAPPRTDLEEEKKSKWARVKKYLNKVGGFFEQVSEYSDLVDSEV